MELSIFQSFVCSIKVFWGNSSLLLFSLSFAVFHFSSCIPEKQCYIDTGFLEIELQSPAYWTVKVMCSMLEIHLNLRILITKWLREIIFSTNRILITYKTEVWIFKSSEYNRFYFDIFYGNKIYLYAVCLLMHMNILFCACNKL